MIACLGETTGEVALQSLLKTMINSEEGSRILAAKPRINSRTIDLDALDNLSDNTFGYHYKQFLRKNVITCLSTNTSSKDKIDIVCDFIERNTRLTDARAVYRRCPTSVRDDPISRMSRPVARCSWDANHNAGRS